MGWSTNQKAQEKREKQKAKKQEDAARKQQQAERKKWKDQETQKKLNSQKEKQEKRQKQAARKRQLKQIAEREEQEMEKIKAKKDKFQEKKLTQAQIAKNIEEREKNKQTEKQEKIFYQDNPNRQFEDYHVAETVQQAINLLDTNEEKHPQKRFKAAYQAYCAKRDIEIRCQFPKLKRSQRLQMMHKQFQKAPENPFNNKNLVAYNDKSRKQARQAREQEKKKEQEPKYKIEEKNQSGDD